TGDIQALSEQIASHRCEGAPSAGCRAETPAVLVLERGGERERVAVHPVYDAELERMRLGFTQSTPRQDVGLGRAFTGSAEEMWRFTTVTVTTIGQIF